MHKLFALLWISFWSICLSAQDRPADGYYYANGQTQPLEQVLKDLENRYKCAFTYSNLALADKLCLPDTIFSEDLKEFMAQILDGLSLEYRIQKEADVLIRPTLRVQEEHLPEMITIEGKILDQKTKQGLSEVAVYLDTLRIGAYTDERGGFSFPLPKYLSDRSIWLQQIGYVQKQVWIKDLDSALPLELEAAPLSLQAITVMGEIPALKTPSKKLYQQFALDAFLQNNASNLAGKDLFRSIQLLPGVSAHNDESATIKIRGSESEETLILLDGMPIYKADHYFGVFSAVNSNFIQSAQLFKNAIPVSYGGKTGGMLSMSAGDDLFQRNSAEIDLNLLTGSLLLNTRLSDKISWTLAGRSTFGNAADNTIFNNFEEDTSPQAAFSGFSRPGLVETQPSFEFFDFNSKIRAQLTDKSYLDFNVFYSNDDLLNKYQNRFRVSARNQQRAINEENFSNAEAWQNTGVSLNLHQGLSQNWKLYGNLYFAKYNNEGSINSSLVRDTPREDLLLWGFSNDQENEIMESGGIMQVSKPTAHGHQFRFGVAINHYQNQVSLLEDDKSTLGSSSTGSTYAVFGDAPLINDSQFQAILGARLSYFDKTEKGYLSPRVRLFYQASDDLNFKASYTYSNQFVRELNHENRLGQSLDFFILADDQDYPVGQVQQVMLGLNVQKGPFSFDLESYYKHHEGLIEHARLLAGFDSKEINPGNNRSYQLFTGEGNTLGLDALLQFEKNNYRGWISYTLSKTEHQFREIFRNTPFPSEDDRRHQLSLVNNYRWKKFSFSANYIFASGRPFTNLSLLGEPRDIKEIAVDQLIDRLPAYHRLDIGVSYDFQIKWTDCSVGVSVFNLTNNENIKYQQFVYSVPFLTADGTKDLSRVIGNSAQMLDRTLNFNFNVKF